jgi:hypothetical protein
MSADVQQPCLSLQVLGFGDHHHQEQQQQGAAQQVGHASAQPEAALLLGSLTQATFSIWEMSAADSPALWRTLWGAMPALQRLVLDWPSEVDLLPQLPPMAAFTGLTSLALSSRTYMPTGYQQAGGNERQSVSLQVLLGLLQGSSRLEKLSLQLGVSSEGVAAGAGSMPGGGGNQDGSGVGVGVGSGGNSSGGGGNPHSSGCISRDSLLVCLQQTLPSLQHLQDDL